MHLRKDRKWRGTEHLFTFHLRLLFFPWSFCVQTFTLIPLTNRKDVTVEKTKFYKRLIFFSCRLFGFSISTSWFSFAIKVRTIFGVDGGCKSLLGQEAPLRAQLMVHSVTPFLFLATQPSPDPWAGFGRNYTSFGYFSPHLVSANCSPTEQRSARGAQRRGGSTKGGGSSTDPAHQQDKPQPRPVLRVTPCRRFAKVKFQ